MLRQFEKIENKELFEKYNELNSQIKELEAQLKEVKESIFANFDGDEIVNVAENVVYKVTTATSVRKELDKNKLLELISDKQLESCYNNKEITSQRITVSKLTK